MRSHDFDMIYIGWPQSLSPGNEQRDFWGSAAADSESSRNYAGIKDPAVDALIERVVITKDRDELVAATRALDRVLLANQYVIPSYTLRRSRIARWDRFAPAGDAAGIRGGVPNDLVVERGEGREEFARGPRNEPHHPAHGAEAFRRGGLCAAASPLAPSPRRTPARTAWPSSAT